MYTHTFYTNGMNKGVARFKSTHEEKLTESRVADKSIFTSSSRQQTHRPDNRNKILVVGRLDFFQNLFFVR